MKDFSNCTQMLVVANGFKVICIYANFVTKAKIAWIRGGGEHYKRNGAQSLVTLDVPDRFPAIALGSVQINEHEHRYQGFFGVL